MKYEVCIDSVQSAINAEEAGANRVELCDNLIEGGTTPSAGMIKIVKQHTNKLETFVIIRPRGGNFVYSEEEKEIMLADIEMALHLGASGIVSGALRSDGHIDIDTTKALIKACQGIPFTFHRAFDLCIDPFLAASQLIDLGVTRILTSGQESTAERGLDLISQLVKTVNNQIIIMPGAGIKPENARVIAEKTKAKEFHFSARKKTTLQPQANIRKNHTDISIHCPIHSDKETIMAIIKNIEYI